MKTYIDDRQPILKEMIRLIYMYTCDEKNKHKIVQDITRMSSSSQLEMLYFLNSISLTSTNNSNGYFFVISDISPQNVIIIQKKIKDIFVTENHENDIISQDLENNSPTSKKSVFSKLILNPPFSIDTSIISSFEHTKLILKKNMCSKYSMAVKKYNKHFVPDIKIDDYDLNEFEAEKYIL